ncbi:MAG: undecaprenyldiphospho-muramoylpentapeptide beta-N-acetylglucosaminyltransferase [Gammaproteobacteria bacterium]|nr:MAG: undecaprenyldiphospho-muramoylpentapeptide beta-N-acetylglucosaminyltransferase [Gammaproteobacteria bacterium]
MTVKRPILIMAGGTGGHVFPALAVAEQLQIQGWPVVWLGTQLGLEARVVPPTGIPIYWIRVRGLRGKGMLRVLSAPFMLIWALFQASAVLLKVRPAAVLGMGGYTTGPGGLMAWLLRRPLIIHEQNSVAGMTNRWLAPLAEPVLEAFPGSLKNAIHTGNPVRRSIAEQPFNEPGVQSRRPRLLVVGGSLGAAVLNEQVPAALAELEQQKRPDVWHQTGLCLIDEARQAYSAAGVEVRLDAFIEDMSTAYQWADLVLCRAGALTIAELAAVGVASILVPYPHAVDDHQTGNARYLVDAGAAVLLPNSEVTPQRLCKELALLQQPQRLGVMARCARIAALPDAAQRVAKACIDVTGWREAA